MAKIFKNTKLIIFLIILAASVLRLWRISEVPVSLFGDELDVGYQAYSILKTGRDYYGNFMPIHFHSLAEWRTPLYLYSAVPSVAIFGISPLGVRLPAAIFGVLSILALYLLVKEITKREDLAIISSFVLAFSPWHIQYSRAGFEATLLLLLLLLGLWLFFKSLSEKKYLWLSIFCLVLTPWVYSTAKLFTPILLVFLFFLYRREILSQGKRELVKAVIAGLIVGIPIAYSTVFGGGTERFNYISIFSDPTIEPEVGTARQIDARMRGETGAGLTPTILDRVIHNKFTLVGGNVIRNYLQAFSTDFLFIKGDPNLRQSIGIGEFYRIEVIALILGLILFFAHSASSGQNAKIKRLMAFWILAGVIPSVLTRDGGNHATRLILILPPLVFLISYGLLEGYKLLSPRFRNIVVLTYLGIWLVSFGLYQHQYWVHYPWESERWWHAGFKESIQSIKEIDKNYDRVIISTANEPPWIFFAGWYEYPPDKWQKEFPIGNDINVSGFGKISHTDKFYFGSPEGEIGIYGIGKYINSRTLYLAVAKEIGANLIMEPGRTPPDLKLVKAVAYPSGEPAFYLFSGK